MIIEVCGRDAALLRAAEATAPTAVISITSTDEPEVAFPANQNVTSILRLRFNDLTAAYDDEGIPYGRPLPEPADFDGLRAFVDALDCQRLIVHCWEGVSRSAAVALAVRTYRGGGDALSACGPLRPNPRVHALACRALGIRP